MKILRLGLPELGRVPKKKELTKLLIPTPKISLLLLVDWPLLAEMRREMELTSKMERRAIANEMKSIS